MATNPEPKQQDRVQQLVDSVYSQYGRNPLEDTDSMGNAYDRWRHYEREWTKNGGTFDEDYAKMRMGYDARNDDSYGLSPETRGKPMTPNGSLFAPAMPSLLPAPEFDRYVTLSLMNSAPAVPQGPSAPGSTVEATPVTKTAAPSTPLPSAPPIEQTARVQDALSFFRKPPQQLDREALMSLMRT